MGITTTPAVLRYLQAEAARRAAHHQRKETVQARQQAERELVWRHLAEPGTPRQLGERTGLGGIAVMAALHVLRVAGSVTSAGYVFSRTERV